MPRNHRRREDQDKRISRDAGTRKQYVSSSRATDDSSRHQPSSSRKENHRRRYWRDEKLKIGTSHQYYGESSSVNRFDRNHSQASGIRYGRQSISYRRSSNDHDIRGRRSSNGHDIRGRRSSNDHDIRCRRSSKDHDIRGRRSLKDHDIRGRRSSNNGRDTGVSRDRHTIDTLAKFRDNQKMSPRGPSEADLQCLYKCLDVPSIAESERNVSLWKGERIYDGLPIVCKVLPGRTALYGQAEYDLHTRAGSDNKGVVKMYEMFIKEDKTILVMEMGPKDLQHFIYDECVSNDRVIQRRQLLLRSEDDYRYIFLQMVNAVVKCHRNGVYHLDIKADNFLIDDETLEVKLIDFGLSVASENGYVKLKGGSCSNLPAEALTSPTVCAIDAATLFQGTSIDLWGLGVVLYELINGRKPFNDPSLYADPKVQKIDVRKVFTSMCTYEEECSFGARLLLDKMLCFDRTQRATVKEMVESAWLKDTEDNRVVSEIDRLHE